MKEIVVIFILKISKSAVYRSIFVLKGIRTALVHISVRFDRIEILKLYSVLTKDLTVVKFDIGLSAELWLLDILELVEDGELVDIFDGKLGGVNLLTMEHAEMLECCDNE